MCKDRMQTNIDDLEFTIFDTETTGLEPESGDRIVELAAVRIKGEKKIREFQSLTDPERPISDAAFQVNGITASMLEGAPKMQEVLPKFLDFAKDSCWCSYNAGFDLAFLDNESRIAGQALPRDIMVADMLKMSRRLLPGLERYTLSFVAQTLGIEAQQKHRALSDVLLSLEVFQCLRRSLKEKGIYDLKNFIELFGVSPGWSQDLSDKKICELQQAIDLGLKVKIKYLSGASALVTEREVLPKEIRQERNHAYLIGHCCLKNQERTFRVDGILHLEVLAKTGKIV